MEEKRQEMHKLITSLPVVTQHLLVLLFGTFRAIVTASEQANTGMTSEALGVSVGPSFFHSCVQDGSKIAKMEDVQRFKVIMPTQFLLYFVLTYHSLTHSLICQSTKEGLDSLSPQTPISPLHITFYLAIML